MSRGSLNKTALPIVAGLLASMLAASPARAQALSPGEAVSAAEVKAIAADAYLYAYPMLFNYKTLFQQVIDPSFPGYIGGFNRFRHYSRGFSPADKTSSRRATIRRIHGHGLI